MYDNPLIPGDPYMYDVKWIISKILEHSSELSTLDEKIQAEVIAALDQHDPIYFDSANALINSGIKAGALAYIEGFYAPGDGGANLYITTDDYNDIISADFYITLSGSNKWAIPVIVTPFVTPEMFGAKGDGVNDDTEAINTAFKTANIVIFGAAKIYAVSDATGEILTPLSNNDINLNGATIKLLTTAATSYQIFKIDDVENVSIKNGKIVGDKITSGAWEYGHGVFIGGSSYVNLSDLIISDTRGDGIYIGVSTSTGNESSDVYINNCIVDDCNRNGLSIIACDGGFITNSAFNNMQGTNPRAGVDIEPNSDKVINVILDNLTSKNCHRGYCIVNTASNSYSVNVGKIISDITNYINLQYPSFVNIDEMIMNLSAGAAGLDCSVANTSRLLLDTYTINSLDTIGAIFNTATGVTNTNINAMNVFASGIVAFAANVSGINVIINVLNFNSDATARLIDNTTLKINHINKATKTVTDSQTLTMFDNDILINHSDAGLLTINILTGSYTDGAVITAYNASGSGAGNARFATSDASQTIVDPDGTASNTIQIPSGKYISMRYSKPAGKWYVTTLN